MNIALCIFSNIEREFMKTKRNKGLQKVLVGIFFSLALMMLIVPATSAYASSQERVNNNQGGDTYVEESNDVDADGYLGGKGTQQSTSKASTKPSTNDVGKGLNDKVSSNAKTGDILNNSIYILLLALFALVISVAIHKRITIQEKE